jgi:DNA gyrase subunit A
MKLHEDRGSLVGGLVVTDNDEVIAIKASGQITRSPVVEVPVKGRDTMGVRFVGVGGNDSVVAIALNPETTADVAQLDPDTADDDAASTDDHDEVLPEPAADSAALSSEVEEDDSE